MWRAMAASSVGRARSAAARPRARRPARGSPARAAARPSAFATSSARPSPRITARSITALELAHVARPGVADEQLEVVAATGASGGVPKRVAARSAKCGASAGDVLGPLAQRRQVDREHREPVPEVLAEAALRRPSRAGRGEWPRRCARRRAAVRWPPTRSKRAVLQHAQQAHLRRAAAARRSRRGTASRRRRARTSPSAAPRRPVKLPRSWPKSSESIRPGGIAPQFTRRNGPAARARARVDRARDHLLARAGLAEQQHRHVRRRDELDALHHGAQPGLGADDRSPAGPCGPSRESSERRSASAASRSARARASRRSFSSAIANGSSSARAISSCSRSKRRGGARDEQQHAGRLVARAASGPTSTSPSRRREAGPGSAARGARRAHRARGRAAAPRRDRVELVGATSSLRDRLASRFAGAAAIVSIACARSIWRTQELCERQRAREQREMRAARPRRARCAGRPPSRRRAAADSKRPAISRRPFVRLTGIDATKPFLWNRTDN